MGQIHDLIAKLHKSQNAVSHLFVHLHQKRPNQTPMNKISAASTGKKYLCFVSASNLIGKIDVDIQDHSIRQNPLSYK